MAESTLSPLRPGYARCVRCHHIFLEHMLRLAFTQFWCPWCLENRPGTPHGVADVAACGCRFLVR
jgi:hypothetical protein